MRIASRGLTTGRLAQESFPNALQSRVFLGNFHDSYERNFGAVGNDVDPGVAHPRAAHAKKRHVGAARNAVASRAAYMSPEASPAEMRICVGGIV